MVGGSSCFHSLCGLFVIPRNKVVPAGLRVGQAVCSGLKASPSSFASSNFSLAVQVGDALYAQDPQVAVLSSHSPQQRPGFSPGFLRPGSNWLSLVF